MENLSYIANLREKTEATVMNLKLTYCVYLCISQTFKT